MRGLQILLKQESHPTLRKALSSIGESVESGSTFAEALALQPKVFTHFYVNMVRAGEAGGVLEDVLARLAEFMEKAVIGTKATADQTMYADFVAAFEAEFDYSPGIYAEYSYDAMKLAALAIEQAGYEDAAAISDALMEIGQGYAGVSGLISFSENGDRGGGTFEVWQVVIDDEGPRFDTVKIISF